MAHDGDPLTDLFYFIQLMRDKDNGKARFLQLV